MDASFYFSFNIFPSGRRGNNTPTCEYPNANQCKRKGGAVWQGDIQKGFDIAGEAQDSLKVMVTARFRVAKTELLLGRAIVIMGSALLYRSLHIFNKYYRDGQNQ